MIFRGLLDKLSSRRRVDKAYEMSNLVDAALQEKGHGLQHPLVEAADGEEVVAPHTALTYMLIGFRPEDHSETGERIPDLSEGRRDIVLRRSSFLDLANVDSNRRSLQPHFVEQDVDLFDGYGCRDVSDLLIQGNVSLRWSVQEIYRRDKLELASVIATIAEPLFHFNFQAQTDYLNEVANATYRDRPDILGLARSAELVDCARSIQ